MRAPKWILASAVCGLFSTAVAAQPGSVTVSHYESLQRLKVQAVDALTSQKTDGTGPVVLSFDALGQSFDFELEPNSNLLSAASRDALPDGVEIYRGQLAGTPGSWARIVVFDGMPSGVFSDGNQLYAIEVPGDSIVTATSPVIFRLADTFVEPGAMTCGSESLSGNGAVLYSKLVGDLGDAVAQGPGAVSEISIGAVGDFEFTSAQGGDANAAAAIVSRLNMVDGYFSQDIGVQIVVPFIETFSTSADPFDTAADPVSGETDSGLLLNELVTYRQNTPAQDSLGLTHLYTGRDLVGSNVGVAWDDTLCRSGFGSGLSEGNGTALFDSLVAAHEIGHNFGAPHDGVPGACAAEPTNFIMAPSVNFSTQFSQCSIGIMQANAALASCISALPTVDMSIALNGQPNSVFLSNSPQLSVDLSNNGLNLATNVEVDITLPNNVTFVSAAPSSGTCTNGAGTVNCQLGNVPGLSGRTVTLTTLASAVGVGTFDATVTSDFDERPGNNQDSVQLTVNSAVDLVINSPAAASININQSTTLSSAIENTSVLDATGLTLSISLNSGLRVDSASWSIGTCTVTNQRVDCQAASLTAQSSSTLSFGVTGLAAGARSYTVALASNEADADTTNNLLTSSVSVIDPNDDGGGGVVGLPFLWLLSLVALKTRRRFRVFR